MFSLFVVRGAWLGCASYLEEQRIERAAGGV
jgi:hypothetical protein